MGLQTAEEVEAIVREAQNAPGTFRVDDVDENSYVDSIIDSMI